MTVPVDMPPTDRTAPSDATDADLLSAVGRGERPALNELARRYGRLVRDAALRQLADTHAADDVTQAVFLVLARRADTIKPFALSSWLHQTTRYAAAKARRGEQRRRRHERAAAKPERVMPEPIHEANPLLPLLDEAIAS